MTAKIAPTSPRFQLWMSVFETDAVHVLPTMVRVNARDANSPQRTYYFAEIGQFTPEVLHRLYVHMALQYGMTIVDAQAEIARYGYVPILADDVHVDLDVRFII